MARLSSAVSRGVLGSSVDARELGSAPDVSNPASQEAVALAPLWIQWRVQKDAAARDLLICHFLPYARMMAATLYGRRTHDDVEFEEYLQLARVGLIEAVDRFDPSQGAQFKTFASKRVQGSILNGLVRLTEKNQQISIRTRLQQERLASIKEGAAPELLSMQDGVDAVSLPSSDAKTAASTSGQRAADKLFKYLAEVGIGVALGVLLEDTGMVDAEAFGAGADAYAPSPEVSYFRKTELRQLGAVLRSFVDQLADQQRLVIRHHYLQEVPFDEIAAQMGVTRGRISQLHRQGLLRLRELLHKDSRLDVSL
ncbi:sigma-70 family RNA polymerase sigma factor [Pseudacidovorax intermedius]|uniref:sigma-70 family RNA polymerase sigma factor n=1 Tax=Pseudacidovorax intermedius TaxID=433924 RepID=UPI0005B8926B|nr:sigma-70 family RNA polymerase sigma factor [Pseudacidovorax intermedius]